MTRDELEAAIWQVLSRYSPCPRVSDVAALLTAAGNYAGEVADGITAERRAVLAAAPARVHLLTAGSLACGSRGVITRDTATTAVAAEVTCRRCCRTAFGLQAAAGWAATP